MERGYIVIRKMAKALVPVDECQCSMSTNVYSLWRELGNATQYANKERKYGCERHIYRIYELKEVG